MAQVAENSPPEAARLAVRRLADSGPDALGALVRLAGSKNLDAADAAQRAVASQFAGWQIELQSTRDESKFAARLQTLAAARVDGAASYVRRRA